MKRIITYIILIIVFTTLGIIGLKNQPVDLPDKDILNQELYLYNINTGEYETLKITKQELSYKGTRLDLQTCKTYTYNKGTSILKLDCNKAIRIIGKVNDSYVFKINNENVFLYNEKEKSFNGEFQRQYNTTYENYVTEGITNITPYLLNYTSLINTLTSIPKTYIYIKNSNCNQTCNIYNNIFANNGITNKYYLDASTLQIEEINNLYSINQILGEIINTNSKYPIIIEIENGIITNQYQIEVDGINFEKYTNIESVVENE